MVFRGQRSVDVPEVMGNLALAPVRYPPPRSFTLVFPGLAAPAQRCSRNSPARALTTIHDASRP
jgi:hypothetical protein